MDNDFYGRRVAVGIGIESTYGTAVAPTMWPRHMKLGFQRKNTTIQNTSAVGRNEMVNDSAITETWAEGPFEGKVYDLSTGFFLLNMFGTVVTTDNADSNPVVKDHTFDIAQNGIAKSLTVTRVDPNTNRRHAMATLETLEFTFEQGQWVMNSGTLHALPGVTGTDVPAYVPENSFTSKHLFVKLASSVAGLGAATAQDIKSGKLTLKREITKYFPFGGTSPSAINVGAWSAEGEVVLRYRNTSLEDLWYANTIQAMQIGMKNTDVTIGASANPGLVFTAPRTRLNTFDMGDDLNTVVEQTLGFRTELDTTAGYMLRAVLTNTQAAYA